MALSERSRSHLYQGLTSVIGDEEAVQEMLSHFPARDVEEPVTQGFVHAEAAGLRLEFSEFRTEMNEFRTEIRAEMNEFRTEIRAEMNEFQSGIYGALRRQTQWLLGVMITLSALTMSLVAFVGR